MWNKKKSERQFFDRDRNFMFIGIVHIGVSNKNMVEWPSLNINAKNGNLKSIMAQISAKPKCKLYLPQRAVLQYFQIVHDQVKEAVFVFPKLIRSKQIQLFKHKVITHPSEPKPVEKGSNATSGDQELLEM